MRLLLLCLIAVLALPLKSQDRMSLEELRAQSRQYFEVANYPKALETELLINKQLIAIGDTVLLAENTFNIGRIHYFLRTNQSNDMSLAYIKQALRISHLYADSAVLYRAHRGLGVILAEQYFQGNLAEIDTAMFHLALAKDIALAQQDLYAASGISCLLGQYSLNAKQAYAYAKSLFEEALDLATQSGKQEGIAYATQKLGYFYTETGNHQQARQFLQSALTQYRTLHDKDGIINTINHLKDFYEVSGGPQEVLTLWDLSNRYKDSVYNENTAQSFAEYQTRYETEKKEREIALLRAETEIKALKIQNNQYAFVAIAIIFLLVLMGLWAIYSQRQLALKTQLAEAREQAQRERFKVILDTEETERKRIAQELHDGVGPLLSTVKMSLSQPDGHRQARALELIDDAVSTIREISHNMMPNALIVYGLESAIRDFLHTLDQMGHIRIGYQQEVSLEVDEQRAVAVYRVFQEAINNAIKYAQATEIDMRICAEANGDVAIHIQDNGIGFDVSEASEGMGLANMRSRMDLIGGNFFIRSILGEGTLVKLTVPPHARSHQTHPR